MNPNAVQLLPDGEHGLSLGPSSPQNRSVSSIGVLKLQPELLNLERRTCGAGHIF